MLPLMFPEFRIMNALQIWFLAVKSYLSICLHVHIMRIFVQFAGMPAWKRRARGGKSIGRQAEATLEMVYRRTAWPSDDVIDGLWDLHKIRKDQASVISLNHLPEVASELA